MPRQLSLLSRRDVFVCRTYLVHNYSVEEKLVFKRGEDVLAEAEKFCYLGDMISCYGGASEAVSARIGSAWNKFRKFFFFFFSTWVFFHEHSRITELQGKAEGIPLTPHYHFHPLHRHLDITRTITAESSLLHIASSRTRAAWTVSWEAGFFFEATGEDLPVLCYTSFFVLL